MSQYCTVIGLDPGETIGIAILSVAAEILIRPEKGVTGYDCVALHKCVQVEKQAQIDTRTIDYDSASQEVHQHSGWNFGGENEAVAQILEMATQSTLPAIVCEDFVLDPRIQGGRDLLSPVRIISSLSWALWSQGMESHIFTQNRTDPKRICTDTRLKQWGIAVPGGHVMRHAQDATRQAYFFLRRAQGPSQDAAVLRWRAWSHLFDDPQIRSKPARKRSIGERIPGLG